MYIRTQIHDMCPQTCVRPVPEFGVLSTFLRRGSLVPPPSIASLDESQAVRLWQHDALLYVYTKGDGSDGAVFYPIQAEKHCHRSASIVRGSSHGKNNPTLPYMYSAIVHVVATQYHFQ